MSFAAVLERMEKVQNPYPGLRPFETNEAHLFFGRDQQIGELVARLQRNRFVAVVGVSGSGKSSLVRAGLIPALGRTHVGAAGARWRIVVTRPGGNPFQNLLSDLEKEGLNSSDLRRSSQGLLHVARQLAADETLLVIVDQFEELFRYKDLQGGQAEDRRRREADASEAAEFVQLLLTATQYLPPVYVVLTMRSDYLGDCAEFRGLPEALNESQYLVPRLTRQQRMEAIEGPLGQTKIVLSLAQRILNDAGDEPDRLPLLQHVLMRTWSQWQKSDPEQTRSIDLKDYLHPSVGGLENALDRHAKELLKDVPEKTAETIFKRLTAEGRTRTQRRRERRNPTLLAELWEACGAETDEERKSVNSLIDHFRQEEATFLTPRDGDLKPESYIDITHESLIHEWGTLRRWVAEETEAHATFMRIYDDAELYSQGKADLWRNPKLQLALDWWKEKGPNAAWARRYIGADAKDDAGFRRTWEFLETSRKAHEAERARARRRRLTIQIGAGAVMLAMTGLFLWAIYSRGRMRKEHESAMARAMAFTSLDDMIERPDQIESSTLYALEAVKREETSANLDTLQQGLELIRKPSAHVQQNGYVWGVAFSPDGRYLVTAGQDKKATVYDITGKKVKEIDQGAEVWAVSFSKKGKYLGIQTDDWAAGYDASSWHELWRNPEAGLRFACVAFGPDGFSLAVAELDGNVKIVDEHTGKAWDVPMGTQVRSMAFSPDGRYLAAGGHDRKLRVTEVQNHRKLWEKGLEGHINSVAFSADSRYVAAGSDDGTVSIFEVKGERVAQVKQRGGVETVAFSFDGRYLATGGDNGTASVFEIADQSEVLVQPHSGAVLSVAFSPNGMFASAGEDGTVDVVEVKSPDEVARMALPTQDPLRVTYMTWDMKYIAVVDEEGTEKAFEIASGKAVSPAIHLQGADEVALSAGGRYVALASPSKAEVFEASTGKLLFSLDWHGDVGSMDLTPDGHYLAIGGNNPLSPSEKPGQVQVFDVLNKTLKWSADSHYKIFAVGFSADGKQLAVGGEDQEVQVFNTERKDPTLRIQSNWHSDCSEQRQPCKVSGVGFSLNGKYLVVWASDKSLRVMDVTAQKEIHWVDLPADPIYAVLSGDDKSVAVSSNDMIGRVYDITSTSTRPQEVWHRLMGKEDFFPISFISTDKYMLMATASYEISPQVVVRRLLWHAQDLVDRACTVMGRNLKTQEWSEFSSDKQPKACPNLP
jgi:WD40 repeat protein